MKRLVPLIVAAAIASTLASATPAQASGCAGPTSGGEWTTYGHDLSNSRHQAEEDAIGAREASFLAPKWTFSSNSAGAGDFTGTPIVADGCIFAGTNMGWIYAVNADNGQLVWKTETPLGGTINNTLAVDGDTVYAFISLVGTPYLAAFDATDGSTLWTSIVDTQEGSDAFSSPVVHDGMVIVGVSGDAAQHDEAGVRTGFHGSYVIHDATTGQQLIKTWTIPQQDWPLGFAGATVTTSAAIDAPKKIVYMSTGSAFTPQYEHPNASAMLRIDFDRNSPTFGQILNTYKGDTFDDIIPGYQNLGCTDLPGPPPPPLVPTGRGIGACGDIDLDFAASPNLFPAADGRLLVGDAQKSGRYHTADATTLSGEWTTTWGPVQPFGGSSTAFDGTRIYGAGNPPGNVYALDPQTGAEQWTSPVADGAHYGLPVASANGVIYTLDVKGFLDAYDASTGQPLLHRPMALGSDTGPVATFGGVSVARHMVFASVGVQNTGVDFTGSLNGYLVAFKPRNLP